ncbi:MAG TPA: DedA family protein [Gaiellaceae bacterium]|nr:DedA family protein [Gaiellaceae bacterium]
MFYRTADPWTPGPRSRSLDRWNVSCTAKQAETVTSFFIQHGLPLLFVVVMLESFGIPLPGETALIAFGVLAAQGHYSIEWVIVIAAAGAIVGDNLGYWLIGRLGGRALFERWRWLRGYAERVLPRAERIMARHGGKTVFFGRFIAVLRFTAAWVAGLGRMHWWRFLFWNAAGGIVWAASVGLVAFYAGKAAADAIQRYGLFAAAGVAALALIALIAVQIGKRRFEERL